jgi:FkbM family methyltransferase
MNQTKRCRYGNMTFRSNDLYIGRSFDLYGEFSEGEVELFRRLVTPGQVVLDVGANIGAHTVPLAQLVGPSGRVLAFEPQRTIYYLLCGNVAQNNLEHIVHCHLAAVGSQRGTISVPELDSNAEQNFGGLSLGGPTWPGADQAPVVRIDDLGLSACHFIKVDVEGMEREVLLGAAETIRRFRPLLYVEDDRSDKSAELRGLLASFGYHLHLHRPLLFRADNYGGHAENVFGNVASHNLYAHHVETASPVPPGEFAMQTLTIERRAPTAPPVQTPAMKPSAEVELSAAAHLNRGLAHYAQAEYAEALAAFEQAATVWPTFVEAHYNVGLTYAAQNQWDEAIAAYRRAVVLNPQLAPGHFSLGQALTSAGQPEPALAHCHEAVRLLPESPQAWDALGNVHQQLERHEEAVEDFQQALRLDPQLAVTHNSLGVSLWQLNRYPEAAECYRRALACDPKLVEAASNLGAVLAALGQFDAAKRAYDRAVELRPDHADSRWNRSLLALLQGDFERGWAEYEYRWQLKSFQVRDCPQPVWDGSSLEGKTILITAEQGLGDAIQFMRYAPLLRRRGARVIAEVHRPLRRLTKTCPGIDRVVVMGDAPPDFDCYAPMLSLPRMFRTNLETVPADVPYLTPDEKSVEQWREELAALPGFKVGIAWKGNPGNVLDRVRSVPLAMFEPLAKVPGVTLISLQKGVGSEQIREMADRFPVVDFGARVDETSGPFVDTSAMMKSLDLVIACDSALAHLAGALAAPLWIPLPRTPDWRWLLDRDDSPWYPTARLFRQVEPGDWTSVFQRMAEELAALIEQGAVVT